MNFLPPGCLIPDLVDGLDENGFEDVAQAIMTTDMVPKMASAEVPFQDGAVSICGMTKGAGMIDHRLAVLRQDPAHHHSQGKPSTIKVIH